MSDSESDVDVGGNTVASLTAAVKEVQADLAKAEKKCLELKQNLRQLNLDLTIALHASKGQPVPVPPIKKEEKTKAHRKPADTVAEAKQSDEEDSTEEDAVPKCSTISLQSTDWDDKDSKMKSASLTFDEEMIYISSPKRGKVNIPFEDVTAVKRRSSTCTLKMKEESDKKQYAITSKKIAEAKIIEEYLNGRIEPE